MIFFSGPILQDVGLAPFPGELLRIRKGALPVDSVLGDQGVSHIPDAELAAVEAFPQEGGARVEAEHLVEVDIFYSGRSHDFFAADAAQFKSFLQFHFLSSLSMESQ